MCYKYTIFDNFFDSPITCRSEAAIKIIAGPIFCEKTVNVYSSTWCYTYIIFLCRFISSLKKRNFTVWEVVVRDVNVKD